MKSKDVDTTPGSPFDNEMRRRFGLPKITFKNTSDSGFK